MAINFNYRVHWTTLLAPDKYRMNMREFTQKNMLMVYRACSLEAPPTTAWGTPVRNAQPTPALCIPVVCTADPRASIFPLYRVSWSCSSTSFSKITTVPNDAIVSICGTTTPASSFFDLGLSSLMNMNLQIQ